MRYRDYKDLKVWQKAMDLTIEVYSLTKCLPREEQFVLSDQMRRAVVSIPSNIAEGMGRMAIKERIHFLDFSYGSLCEIMCQMEIALSLQYITQQQFTDFESLAIRVSKTIVGLKTSLSNKLQNINCEDN